MINARSANLLGTKAYINTNNSVQLMINSDGNKSEGTLGNNSTFYSGFMSHAFSYLNFSPAFHADLKSDQFEHTSLSLDDHSGIPGIAQYGNGGQNSPKQVVQIEDIHPGGFSSTPQNDFWDTSFHIVSADHPWAESGTETAPYANMNSPLPRRDSGYETTNESGDEMHLDVDKNAMCLTKSQNEGYVHFSNCCKARF